MLLHELERGYIRRSQGGPQLANRGGGPIQPSTLCLLNFTQMGHVAHGPGGLPQLPVLHPTPASCLGGWFRGPLSC